MKFTLPYPAKTVERADPEPPPEEPPPQDLACRFCNRPFDSQRMTLIWKAGDNGRVRPEGALCRGGCVRRSPVPETPAEHVVVAIRYGRCSSCGKGIQAGDRMRRLPPRHADCATPGRTRDHAAA